MQGTGYLMIHGEKIKVLMRDQKVYGATYRSLKIRTCQSANRNNQLTVSYKPHPLVGEVIDSNLFKYTDPKQK